MRKSPKIKSIKAREVLDSKGDPTVEVKLRTDFGIFKALTPSGVSTGRYEAVEIRDGGKRYFGKGVKKAIRNIERIIAPKLKGKDTTKQKEIDDLMIELDGTKNKNRLGANAILPVSMAVCRAGAEARRLPLYKYIAYLSGTPISKVRASGIQPCFLIIEGGLHAGGNLDIQEFM
ncbi:phosphopyruvate hydratase, partial [bacterium]|nr:phosphopyruvate hydratase [bacterium]